MHEEKTVREEEDCTQPNGGKPTAFRKLIDNDVDPPSSNDAKSNNNNREPVQSRSFGIVVSNATAKWTSAQTENSLKNVHLTVRPGRLVAVIGPVGAGKVFAHKPYERIP